LADSLIVIKFFMCHGLKYDAIFDTAIYELIRDYIFIDGTL